MPVNELHENIFLLLENLCSISPEMLNFDALRDVFEDIVAPELIDISNFTKLVVFT